MAPNWPQVIAEIVASGLTNSEIAKRIDLSVRGITYLAGGRQPFFHRGERLLALWCERTGQPREAVPMAPVLRGHRMARRAVDASPQVQSLPAWPPAVQHVEMQGKPRRARKVKEAA